METARFFQVVAKCGPPKVHTQWLPLAKDAELKAAVEDERVMTVHLQTVGSKKDHGEIGLSTQGQRTLLIFPKTLRRFAGKRVVGIDYSLLHTDPVEEEEDKEEVEAKSPPRKRALKAAAKPASKPEPKRKVKLRLVKKRVAKAKTAEPSSVRSKPSKPPAKKASKKSPVKAATKKKSTPLADLNTVIRKAMKQLSQGKEVAAYQTLQGGLEG